MQRIIFMETKTWKTRFIIRYKVRFYITHNFTEYFYKSKCFFFSKKKKKAKKKH